MIYPDACAPPTACDADPRCRHVACFQVRLEASQPEQAHRQAFSCAYHVADVIEALRGWAREHDLAGGQLTVLAIEPDAGTAGGRQAPGTGRPDTDGLRQFAFTTLPLRTIPPGPAPHREPTS
jgi:hypothetical protein